MYWEPGCCQKKGAIESHIDKDMELKSLLSSSGQQELLDRLEFENMDIQFFYTWQSNPLGLGGSIRYARYYVHDEGK